MPRSDRSPNRGRAAQDVCDELESDLREVLRVADECAAQVVEAAACGGGGGGGNQAFY